MNNRIRLMHAGRFLAGIVCFIISLLLVFNAAVGFVIGPIGVVMVVLVGVTFAIVGAILLSPYMTEFLAKPFERIYYSPHRCRNPDPKLLQTAELDIKAGMHDQSLTIYESVIENFPRAPEGYEGAIKVSLLQQDIVLANQYFKRASRKLNKIQINKLNELFKDSNQI